MLPLDHPDRIQITFDDHRLVANPGPLLPVALAQYLGLRELVDRQVRVDSGRGQDRTLRGKAPVEGAIDGWS